MYNTNNIGWGIFGRSSGLQYKTAGCISNFNISSIVDLHSSYILLYPNTEVFCLIREKRSNSIVNYYIHYRYAKEIKTNRAGSFYASLLVLVNCTADQNVIVNFLKGLINHTAQYINEDNRFTKNIDEIDLPDCNIDELYSSFKSVDSEYYVENNEGLITVNDHNPENIVDFFKIAESNEVTRFYSKIYGTSNKEVIDFVKQKEKIEILNPLTLTLNLEIQKLKKERETLEINLRDTINQNNILINDYNRNVRDLEKELNTSKEIIDKLKVNIRKYEQNTDLETIKIEYERIKINYKNLQNENKEIEKRFNFERNERIKFQEKQKRLEKVTQQSNVSHGNTFNVGNFEKNTKQDFFIQDHDSNFLDQFEHKIMTSNAFKILIFALVMIVFFLFVYLFKFLF